MKKRPGTGLRWGAVAACLALAATPAAAIDLDLDPDQLEAILASAAPYSIPLRVAGFTETLRCGNPRDLVLTAGTIRLRATCTGSPVPIRAEVEPQIRFERDPESGALRGVLASMPLRVPFAGSIDLADSLGPIEIPAVIRHPVRFEDGPRIIEIRIRDLRIQPEKISLAFDLRFLPVGAAGGGDAAAP